MLEIGAAPGGKVTAMAEAMDDRGLVVVVDVRANRLGLVDRAAARLGLQTVDSVTADGRRLPFAPGTFDRVLVDRAMLGARRVAAPARGPLADPGRGGRRLAALQCELLAAAAPMVRPGGRLVYSVCTLTAAETTAVDDWVGTTLADFVAEPPPDAPWRESGRGALPLPQAAGTDGMYLLTLTRSADPQN